MSESGSGSESVGKSNSALTQYSRRKVLEELSKTGCRPEIRNQVLRKCPKGSHAAIPDFLNKHAQKSQENVGEEAASPEFSAVENWIKYFKDRGFHTECGFELPLAFKTIAMTEEFPECDPEKDVDFKKLYLWLSDVMQGYAPPKLNEQSQLFLVENLTDMLELSNTPENGITLARMINVLSNKPETDPSSSKKNYFLQSLDPLHFSLKTLPK